MWPHLLLPAVTCLFFLVPLLSLERQDSVAIGRFVDVTAESGIQFKHRSGRAHKKDYIFEAKGGGAALLDYDGDGWLDVLIVQGSTLERLRAGQVSRSALFRNRRDGTFEDVTSLAELVHSGWGMGVAVADYDNDGDPDVYLTTLGKNHLYRNDGNGHFQDVTNEAGVGDAAWSTSAAFGDFDRDGFLDLYVCNYIDLNLNDLPLPGSNERCSYQGQATFCGPAGLAGARDILYKNNGDGSFSDVTAAAGDLDRERLRGLGVVWADLDNDQDLDLYIANDAQPNFLYENLGSSFGERALSSGVALSGDARAQAGMGLDAADYNNDGLLDLFVTHFASDYSTLYRNEGGLIFEDISLKAGIVKPEWLNVGWGTCFADFNHDGWRDLFVCNGHVYPFLGTGQFVENYQQQNSLYLNRSDGSFRDVSLKAGLRGIPSSVSRGAAFGDYDRDGDVDVLVANLDDSPRLLRNDSPSRARWVQFLLRGRQSNRDGIGARISLKTPDSVQVAEVKTAVGIYSASSPQCHFGLGKHTFIDALEVQWPGGKIQRFEKVPSDRSYLIDEDDGLQALDKNPPGNQGAVVEASASFSNSR